ncbi:MAG: ATP-binding cassette domain-containing protein [Phycisphaerae bacterium]|nr:ATP-binding cassette domain-containing protein [Phycisphaerae bacterium]
MQHAIELHGVSVFRLGRPILEDLDLCVRKHACCAVIGPNGAGKSALISILSGYAWTSTGQVRVNGSVFGRVPLEEVRRGIGLIEQSRSPEFPPLMAVRDLVATGLFGTICLPLGRDIAETQWARVDREIKRLGLDGFKDHPFGRLSTGEKMKALIARAMLSDPELLLLDEPSVGLDIGARAKLIQHIDALLHRAQPPTILIVTHHLDELPVGVDQVVLLKEGRIFAQGRPEHVLTSERMSDLFACRIHVMRDHGRFVASVM